VGVPAVPHVEDVRLEAEGAAVARFDVELDVEDGDWVVLRLADAAAVNERPGPQDHPGSLRALAYASPFWLTPQRSSST
jgi:hypothetical protein